jgi:hypothetical protein
MFLKISQKKIIKICLHNLLLIITRSTPQVYAVFLVPEYDELLF